MIKAGLTGNIGSGKSTVAKVFKTLGVKVFSADDEAKKLLNREDILAGIIDIFGNEILNKDGMIDRKALAHIAFNNKPLLSMLNNIIHPEVRNQFETWMEEYRDETYIIHEAAILFESGFNTMFDKIIFVSAPEELRIKRIMNRDGVTRESVLARISNQSGEKEKIKKSDFIVQNDGRQLIIPQVIEIHKQLKKA